MVLSESACYQQRANQHTQACTGKARNHAHARTCTHRRTGTEPTTMVLARHGTMRMHGHARTDVQHVLASTSRVRTTRGAARGERKLATSRRRGT